MYAQANLYYWVFLFLRLAVMLYSIYFIWNQGYRKQYKRSLPIILGLLLTVICVVEVSGDYWSYKRWYDAGLLMEEEHFEPIWYYIRNLVPYGFDYFRLAAWGSGILLFCMMCRNAKVDLALALCLFGMFYISLYGYARASVALMFVLFAFVFYWNAESKRKNTRIIVFLTFAICGMAMHRSMIMIIPALLLAPRIHINRNTIIYSVILYPFLAVIINLLIPIVSNYFFASEFYGQSEVYLNSSNVHVSFLSAILTRLSLIIPFFYAFSIYSRSGLNTPIIDKVASAAFLIIYTGLLFVSVIGINTSVMFYRILNMAFPFMIITITYTLKDVKEFGRLVILMSLYELITILLTIRIFYITPNFIIKQIQERYFI